MLYTVPFDDIASGTTDDTYRTIALIIVPDTDDGHRARIRRVVCGPSDNTPLDNNYGLDIRRIADQSAGSAGTPASTITGANMPKIDPGSQDAIFSAGIDYSGGEPGTYESNPVWQAGCNAHGRVNEMLDDTEMPIGKRDQTLGLRICPRGTTANRVSGYMVVEVF